jgi:hypothetical protein
VQEFGKFSDAVLGEFTPEERRFIVAVEGKGPTDPLDRPFKGRTLSAVDQGYRYAINLPCDWIIVTSMRQTRLYCKGTDQNTYELFSIGDLATNDYVFKKFVYLLAAERVVPPRGRCHLDVLREASDKAGRELTKEYYQGYAAMRVEAEQLERTLSDCVNEAYALTPDEVALMWATAPPRMPIASRKEQSNRDGG